MDMRQSYSIYPHPSGFFTPICSTRIIITTTVSMMVHSTDGPSHSPNIAVGLYNEADFTKPRPVCPTPSHWHTHDLQGTEIEVIEMVAGMIVGLQPETVLETGTSRGFMAEAISDALHVNGHGKLISYEPDETTHTEAANRVTSPKADLRCEPSMQTWIDGPIDFAWHDSLISLRRTEFGFYLPHYSNRAVVCFHDTAPHFGQWSEALRSDLTAAGFNYIDWPSPRGIIIARRN